MPGFPGGDSEVAAADFPVVARAIRKCVHKAQRPRHGRDVTGGYGEREHDPGTASQAPRRADQANRSHLRCGPQGLQRHDRPSFRADRAMPDVADVMAGVGFAREHGLLLAVRGGAHNGPGLGTCDGGLVLDLAPIVTSASIPRVAPSWSPEAPCGVTSTTPLTPVGWQCPAGSSPPPASAA